MFRNVRKFAGFVFVVVVLVVSASAIKCQSNDLHLSFRIDNLGHVYNRYEFRLW